MTATVGDDENLFRRVQDKAGDQLCYEIVGGRIVFLHAAFNDPEKRPSVFRALIKRNPQLSRRSIEDGIVALSASAIRNLGPIAKRDRKGADTDDTYDVNVLSDPVRGNCSHAVIAMAPSTVSKGTFMRLKDGLARLATEAGWTVQPNTHRPNQYGHVVVDAAMCVVHRFRGRV